MEHALDGLADELVARHAEALRISEAPPLVLGQLTKALRAGVTGVLG
jgi:hypothetical protein